VEIAGHRFSVRTDAKPKYVKELAAFVTRKIDEARKSGKIATTQSLAVLAALTIADELFQEREQRRSIQREVRETSQRILRYLDQETSLS
jgi:cell division protein ZapA (FtsZ GTPase activity inhibitor)